MRRFAVLLLSIWLLPLAAFGFEEGIEYQRVVPPQPTDDPSKVEVVELFWYGCPHCYHFEPILEAWAKNKPDYVYFKRIPAIFRDSWVPFARAYYTAQVLGVLDRIHGPLFKAIHVERRNLNSEAALRAFFAEHGVKPEDFDRTYRSFAVENDVRRAADLTRRYGINGVPAIVINGKVYSAPKIMDEIAGGKGVISGSFTEQEATELAAKLNER